MSRPRKPSNVIEITGGYKRNPQRRRKSEPKPEGALTRKPPAHIEAGPAKCWKEIVSVLPAKVLTGADAYIVETAATLMAQFRADPVTMPASKLSILVNCLTRIGMTPADRSKIDMGEGAPAENDFDDI